MMKPSFVQAKFLMLVVWNKLSDKQGGWVNNRQYRKV